MEKETPTPHDLTQSIATIVLDLLGDETETIFAFADKQNLWEYALSDTGAGFVIREQYGIHTEQISLVPRPEGGFESSAPDGWLPGLYQRLWDARNIRATSEPLRPIDDYTRD